MKLCIAENIKKFRKERGMTQERLAEVFGVTVGAVSKWEAGSTIPDLYLIVEMADFFETSVDVLLGYGWKARSMGDAVNRIKELRNAKSFDEATLEAEKALERYPNSFEIVFQAAIMYSVKGIELKSAKSHRRALELFKRSLELIGQNTDNEINEWLIQNRIASTYLCLDEQDKALELMKKNNVGGLNNARLGYTIASMKKESKEAIEYLFPALINNITDLILIMSGYATAYEELKDYRTAREALEWTYKVIDGLKLEGKVSYFDKFSVQLDIACAVFTTMEENIEKTTYFLKRAKKDAEKFDFAPDYKFRNIRFGIEQDKLTAFDDFGKLYDGIDKTVEEEAVKYPIIKTVWEKVKNGECD